MIPVPNPPRRRLSRQAQIDLIEIIGLLATGVVTGGATVDWPPYLLFVAGLVATASVARRRQLERYSRRKREEV